MNFYLTVGANIKKFRDMRGYSLQVLADKIGVTKKTIQRYETGEIKIDMERLGDIASALGVRVSVLISDTKAYNEIREDVETYATDNLVMVPIVGKISCGNGTLAFEDIEGYEPVPEGWLNGGDYFCLRAKGDSMIGARIHEGDLLLIRRQPEVENGEIAAVLIEEEAVLKRVYLHNNQVVLQSENPDYPPIILPLAETVIVGKLKKIIISV